MDPVSKASFVQNNEPYNKKLGGQSGKGFMPGKSGNPGGRPLKKPITEIYEEVFNDPAAREAIKQQVIRTMSDRGMAGVLERDKAADRLEGKVAQKSIIEATVTLTLEQVLEAKKKAGK